MNFLIRYGNESPSNRIAGMLRPIVFSIFLVLNYTCYAQTILYNNLKSLLDTKDQTGLAARLEQGNFTFYERTMLESEPTRYSVKTLVHRGTSCLVYINDIDNELIRVWIDARRELSGIEYIFAVKGNDHDFKKSFEREGYKIFKEDFEEKKLKRIYINDSYTMELELSRAIEDKSISIYRYKLFKRGSYFDPRDGNFIEEQGYKEGFYTYVITSFKKDFIITKQTVLRYDIETRKPKEFEVRYLPRIFDNYEIYIYLNSGIRVLREKSEISEKNGEVKKQFFITEGEFKGEVELIKYMLEGVSTYEIFYERDSDGNYTKNYIVFNNKEDYIDYLKAKYHN